MQLHERAAAYGMAARRIDGSDVGAVTESAAWAVERARRGQGPTFLEIEAELAPLQDDIRQAVPRSSRRCRGRAGGAG